jgi:hypothetical protein
MSITTNIESFVNDVPKFEFKGIENGDAIHYALTFKFNNSYYVEPPSFLKQDVEDFLTNFNKCLLSFLNELNKHERFTVLRNGKIIYKPYEFDEDLIQCSNCGNVWDGYAQCTCYLYDLCYC